MLIGVRDMSTLVEVDAVTVATDLGLEAAVVVVERGDGTADTPNALLASVRDASPLEREGFVAVDADWQRVKLKSARYVARAFLADADDNVTDGIPSEVQLISIIRMNEVDELLAYFPAWRPVVEALEIRLNAWLDHLAEVETATAGLDRKGLALYLADLNLSHQSVFFGFRYRRPLL